MSRKGFVIIISAVTLISTITLIVLIKQRRDKLNAEFDKIEKQLEMTSKVSDFSYHLTTSKNPDVILQSKKAMEIIDYISEMRSAIYEEVNSDKLNNAVDSSYIVVVKSTHLKLKEMLLNYKAFVELKFPGTIKKENHELNCDVFFDGEKLISWEQYANPINTPLAAILGNLAKIKNDLKKVAERIDERYK